MSEKAGNVQRKTFRTPKSLKQNMKKWGVPWNFFTVMSEVKCCRGKFEGRVHEEYFQGLWDWNWELKEWYWTLSVCVCVCVPSEMYFRYIFSYLALKVLAFKTYFLNIMNTKTIFSTKPSTVYGLRFLFFAILLLACCAYRFAVCEVQLE